MDDDSNDTSSPPFKFDFDSPQSAFLGLGPLPTTYRPLPPAIATAFQAASERLALAFLADPSDDTLLPFLSLPKVGLTPFSNISKSVLHLSRFPQVPFPQVQPPTGIHKTSAQVQVQKGRLSTAARMLEGDSAVADLDEAAIESLRSKHPAGPLNPFGNGPGPVSSSVPLLPSILDAFRSFKQDTAPGISGWTVPLLKVALRSLKVTEMLHTLCTLMIAGGCPGRSMLCTSRWRSTNRMEGSGRSRSGTHLSAMHKGDSPALFPTRLSQQVSNRSRNKRRSGTAD